ncbi:hypothetical protein E3N88_38071 [Mikania micrantha]|uniref:Uncharacterized protein n=1 Tax=Mikania micrantha TaxID=192012 RepID=A0A5N6LSY3_9ASTR|nr:hypothetical protein E3N88_38071 [Mikania micrantha]
MMDLLHHSRLFFALNVNPRMYVSTLREFWANAIITTHNDKPISISSVIQLKPVTITPEILNNHLQLHDDDTCVLAFDKTTMQSAFVDVGYVGTFAKVDTLLKAYLPPPYKYLLHTLMVCFSKKSGSFDQASNHVQELFYSLIKNQKYSLSNYIFNDLIANHYEKFNKFLMYPRILSFVLSKLLDQSIIEQGDAVYMKSQTVKVFTSPWPEPQAHLDHEPIAEPQSSAHDPIDVASTQSSPICVKHPSSPHLLSEVDSLRRDTCCAFLVSKLAYLESKLATSENIFVMGQLEIDEMKMQLAKKQEHHSSVAPVAQSNLIGGGGRKREESEHTTEIIELATSEDQEHNLTSTSQDIVLLEDA